MLSFWYLANKIFLKLAEIISPAQVTINKLKKAEINPTTINAKVMPIKNTIASLKLLLWNMVQSANNLILNWALFSDWIIRDKNWLNKTGSIITIPAQIKAKIKPIK